MAVTKGRALVTSKNSVAITGELSATVTEEGAIIEYETKSMDGPGREYDGLDCTIALEGVIDSADTGALAIQTAKYGQSKLTDITVLCAWGTYSGTFVVESCEISGAVGEMQQFSCTLKSDNGYTFTGA